ncbi:MAG TPA: CHAT domain-containing protein, partial [Puia sp.]|nr:CHAT domain-containing protein [Puia sp.]
GEQSKLYWRNKTREIFANGLDACYFSGNTALAFLFMEKSRAVLLNDKLIELGALAQLPMQEALIQRQQEVDLTSLQQTASSISADSPSYAGQQLRLLRDREKFERYVRSLENKYPVYYQYKYADSVPSLRALQSYLAENRTTFLHFFTTDTVNYILCIEASAARLVRLPEKVVDRVRHFLGQCADEQRQNTGYTAFAAESHHLYELLFQPLSVRPGRVIVCSDEFLLPFESLYRDKEGKQPLLYDYAFSYVYSARTLLKTAAIRPAKGNFIGFAPVSFVTGLHLADLKLSADSLRSAAAAYQQTDLYTNASATRNNFLQKISGYAVANVFSHAQADSNGNEPVLFMQDSIIHLSELQLLPFPATQLVVLSACQTGAGRNASGEGIYSLARGFSSAGIPAVAATLWEADESAIYAVSARFHYYLSRGEPKDLALQKAKLDYIHTSDRSAMLPWYWANLIIIGNTAPVRLSVAPSGWWGSARWAGWWGSGRRAGWWWVVAVVLVTGMGIGGYFHWKQRR